MLNPNDPAFSKTLWDAEDIFYNGLPDPTNGATRVSFTPDSASFVE
jgi:hypothetical protein